MLGGPTDVQTIDLGPATAEVARVVAGIRDEQLTAPTPCEGTTVAGLLDHLTGLTHAFRMAAEKTPVEGAASADPGHLPADWRTRIPAQLDALAAAWRDPAAHEGTARAGGVDMPAGVAAVVALDEVVVHGWDLAVATGQPYDVDDAAAEACRAFAESFGDDRPPGLYGPVVPVPADAPALHRLLGATGRDPSWRPPG
ncbi:TIGR03086 family metal-binding protein [Geodermatophilus saharensis]|uniref:TIGR03086 family metal-binding protein n=1 Tax=Geodermatophilus saharensis TaxID=1137994 RepID=UPI001FEA8C6E|nr:TIGR03086 family metal-binding protein [Geodermatophilus saharensis]